MKGKINLLFITGIFYPLMGGPTVALDSILPYIVKDKRIEKVIILTTYVPGEEVVEVIEYGNRDIKVLRLLIPRKSIFQGKNMVQKPFQGFGVLYNGLMISLVCIQNSINVVHDIFRYEYMVTKFLDIPSIMDIRSLGRESPRFKPDLVIAISKRISDMHENWAGESIEDVPIPLSSVDLEDDHVKKTVKKYGIEEESYICFVGRMTREKGLDLMLESFEKLKEEMPDLNLVLIGGSEGGSSVDELEHYCDKDHIHCLGELDHSETLVMMDDSEVVALPSRREGIPRVMLEAFQLKKKVLAPNCVDEFREQIPDFVVQEDDAQTIKNQLENIITEDRKPDYDLEQHEPGLVSKRWVDIYEELLHGGMEA